MATQTSTHMTIKEAAAHHGVSDKTIRRWIKQGRVNAEQVEGRWQVHVDRDDAPPEVQDNVPNDQDNDLPDENGTGKSEDAGASMVIDQMQSEITHLRDPLQGRDTQIDHLTKLFAMQTNQNTILVEQLGPPPPPRTSLYTRFTELVAKLKNGTQNGPPTATTTSTHKNRVSFNPKHRWGIDTDREGRLIGRVQRDEQWIDVTFSPQVRR